jgi:hypothetical protein
MMEVMVIHLLIRANKKTESPTAGIFIYDRFNTLVFAAGTRQIECPLPPLDAGEQIIVRMDLKMTVQPGEYTFTLGTSEPSLQDHNSGIAHDRIERLGPIKINYDFSKTLPFYGIASLSLDIHHARVRDNNVDQGYKMS